jgi:hypothetical protein
MRLSQTLILSIILFMTQLSLKSQVLMDYKRVIKPDYCLKDSADAINLIGRQVKIWHEGGVYSTLNTIKKFKWPSEDVKKRGGQSGWGTFKPQAGDTGIIVQIYPDNGNVNKYIYLLKIRDYYVPLGCSYVTDIDKLDIHKQSVQDWINDSIANVNYAAGCKFKLKNINNNWSRAGLTNIDKQSEEFACSLIAKGIDTVILCKYIFDNGSLPIEKAFILWLDNGESYVKSFFNNLRHQPTQNKIVSFDSKALINYFFENRIDTVPSKPKSEMWISHSLGYSIQLYIPSYFYRERLTDFIIRQDKIHPKAAWWNMISEKLSMLKEE